MDAYMFCEKPYFFIKFEFLVIWWIILIYTYTILCIMSFVNFNKWLFHRNCSIKKLNIFIKQCSKFIFESIFIVNLSMVMLLNCGLFTLIPVFDTWQSFKTSWLTIGRPPVFFFFFLLIALNLFRWHLVY